MSAGKRYSPAIVLGIWTLVAAAGVTDHWTIVVFLILLTAAVVTAEVERARLRR